MHPLPRDHGYRLILAQKRRFCRRQASGQRERHVARVCDEECVKWGSRWGAFERGLALVVGACVSGMLVCWLVVEGLLGGFRETLEVRGFGICIVVS